MREWIDDLWPPFVTLLVGTALGEVLIQTLGISPLLLPAPSAVAIAAYQHSGTLFEALAETTRSVAVGLALSSLAGIAAGSVLASARWIQRAFYPYALFFQIVPIVAIAPLLVIWFGYGARAVIAAAFIVSIFPVIANTLAGLLSVDPALQDLFRLYGAGRLTTLWKLHLPWALPFILTGLRIASGLAVIGAIVGEFVGGGGLGVVVLEAMRQQRTALVFAAIGYASLLGLFLFGLVSVLSHVALRRWHALEQSS
jgi:NitT/TauT family transport system permease protein